MILKNQSCTRLKRYSGVKYIEYSIQAVQESKNTLLNILCFEFQSECFKGKKGYDRRGFDTDLSDTHVLSKFMSDSEIKREFDVSNDFILADWKIHRYGPIKQAAHKQQFFIKTLKSAK